MTTTTKEYRPADFREQARIERGLGSRIRPAMWEQAAAQAEQIDHEQQKTRIALHMVEKSEAELKDWQGRAQRQYDENVDLIAKLAKRDAQISDLQAELVSLAHDFKALQQQIEDRENESAARDEA